MSVYVDYGRLPYGRMLMSHMIADSLEELFQMADTIGISRRWFQRESSMPHFDICQSKRKLAVRHGAIECHRAEFVNHMHRIRSKILINLEAEEYL